MTIGIDSSSGSEDAMMERVAISALSSGRQSPSILWRSRESFSDLSMTRCYVWKDVIDRVQLEGFEILELWEDKNDKRSSIERFYSNCDCALIMDACSQQVCIHFENVSLKRRMTCSVALRLGEELKLWPL